MASMSEPATCSRPAPVRWPGLLPLALSAGIVLGVVAPGGPASADPIGLRVMTQNMDEGTDFSALAAAQSLPQFLAAVSATFLAINATDPTARAVALAQEIATAQPSLIGLQEASILRVGDGPPAATVQSDQLQALLGALASLGQHYAPVAIYTGLDAEAPSTLGFDVRLTDRNVILARTDLPGLSVANAQAHAFATRLIVPLPAPLGAIDFNRGWASVDVALAGRSFRFVTTHLDIGDFPTVQLAQAEELLQTAGNTPLPTIYAGDFNSAADAPADPSFVTYQALLGAGLRDAWTQANPGEPGLTCCQPADLLNPVSDLQHRIDLIAVSDDIGVEAARLVGDEPQDRTPSGLWPSDHAGLVADLILVPEPAALPLVILGLLAMTLRRRAIVVGPTLHRRFSPRARGDLRTQSANR